MTRRASITGEQLSDCAGIAVCGAMLLLVLRPLQDAPFVDDWLYAWAVQRLLATGELRILDWSSNLHPVQVLWGALFCLPWGFSFSALRLSTWVLGVSAVCALYVMLRDLHVKRHDALVGAALLGANPVFFVLAHTFMSDVPFLALMTWTSVAMVRALKYRSTMYLIAAAALASLAIGIRAVGAAIPFAMVFTVVRYGEGWGRKPPQVVVAAIPMLFALGLVWWGTSHLEHYVDLSAVANAPVNRIRALRVAVPLLPQMLMVNVPFSAETLGLMFLPLSLAAFEWRRFRRVVQIAAVLCISEIVAWMVGHPYAPPLSSGATWALTELGATAPLLPNYDAPSLPAGWVWIAPAVALASFSIVLATVIRSGKSAAEMFLTWLGLVQFGVMALLWLFYDRYALVLVPSAIALFLARAERVRLRIALPLIALLGAVACLGMRDHLQLNRALWQAVAELRARGVPDDQIDGGYVVSGWLHYAHPEHAPRDAGGRLVVPGVTAASGILPYEIAFRPAGGWKVLARVPYNRWLGPSGWIWVLERQEAAP